MSNRVNITLRKQLVAQARKDKRKFFISSIRQAADAWCLSGFSAPFYFCQGDFDEPPGPGLNIGKMFNAPAVGGGNFMQIRSSKKARVDFGETTLEKPASPAIRAEQSKTKIFVALTQV